MKMVLGIFDNLDGETNHFKHLQEPKRTTIRDQNPDDFEEDDDVVCDGRKVEEIPVQKLDDQPDDLEQGKMRDQCF